MMVWFYEETLLGCFSFFPLCRSFTDSSLASLLESTATSSVWMLVRIWELREKQGTHIGNTGGKGSSMMLFFEFLQRESGGQSLDAGSDNLFDTLH